MLNGKQNSWKEFLDIAQSFWGMIFRAIFIISIGLIAYNTIDSYDIGDIPLAQLTLRKITGRLLSIGLVVLCMFWFFKFPNQYDRSEPDPYISWARFSYLVIVAMALFSLYYLLQE